MWLLSGLDYSRIMARVRMLRDEFTGDVIQEMSTFMDKLIIKSQGSLVKIEPNLILRGSYYPPI
jgi:hypothetical protein